MKMKFEKSEQAKEKEGSRSNDKRDGTKAVGGVGGQTERGEGYITERGNGLEASMFPNCIVHQGCEKALSFVLISAWQPNRLSSPQTVTFESFLANYNNSEHTF